MEVEDIIEAINKISCATLVLHRKMTVHPKFKVYKVYSYSLYRVDLPEKQLLLEWSVTRNAPAENIGRVWREADKEYLPILVNWLSSDNYKPMKK